MHASLARLPSNTTTPLCTQQLRSSGALKLGGPRAALLRRRVSLRPASMVVVAQAGGSSHAGRAVLHDFCMTIPYAAIALVSALVAAVARAPSVGLQLAGAGAAVAVCSVLSLRSWKAGGSSAPYTLVSAGASGWIAFQMWQRVAASVTPVPSGIVLALSAALAAFCLYNVLAGGNPPPAARKAS